MSIASVAVGTSPRPAVRTCRATASPVRTAMGGGDRPRAAVRLTRRGRLLLLLVALAVALAVVMAMSAPAASSGETHSVAGQTVVVASGETLWDIASRVAPDEDPRIVIAQIVELNSLQDAGSVRVGQRLDVPVY